MSTPAPVSKAKGAVLLTSARFVSSAINFLSTRYILDWIGKAGYGAAWFLFPLHRYLQLMEFGFLEGGQQRMTEAVKRNDEHEAWEIWLTQFRCIVLIGFLGLLVFFGLSFFLRIPEFPTGSSATSLYICSAVFLLFQLTFQSVQTAYVSRSRFKQLATQNAVSSTVAALATLACAYLFRNPQAYVLGMASGPALTTIVITIRNFREMPPEVRRGAFHLGHFRQMTLYGKRNIVNRLFSTFSSTSDRIASGTLGTEQVTKYQNSTRLDDVAFELLGPFNQVMIPEFTEAKQHSSTRFSQVLSRNSRMALAIGLVFILIPGSFGAAIFPLWLKSHAPVEGPIILLLYAIYRVFELYFAVKGLATVAHYQPHLQAPFTAFIGITSLILAGPVAFRFGIIGIAALYVAIDTIQFIPLHLVVYRKLAPELRLGKHLALVFMAMSVAGLYSAAAFWMTSTDWFKAHPWVAIALIPVFMLACMFTLLRTHLMPVPHALRKRKFLHKFLGNEDKQPSVVENPS